MGRLVPFSLALIVSLCGCRATVGTRCTPEDLELAREIVYAPDGTPSYAGQSLVLTSCGGGSFCHSEGATQRYGAPFDLNFDPILADSPGFPDLQTGERRLQRIQGSIHRLRNDIYATVVEGSMPPGQVGRDVQRDTYRRYTDDVDPVGTPLPTVGTPEGREILRNWLACGSPVVGTEFASTPVMCDTDADCTVTHDCDELLGECQPVGTFVAHRVGVVSPTWAYIYPAIIRPNCATAACHGAARSGDLDMSTPALARMELIDTESFAPGCGTRVVPGDPTMSFVIEKLENTQDPDLCGVQMPISTILLTTEQIALIRTWIMNGALDD